ncbi:MAG: sigma-70 family RNA polymerase sigma factor [Epulopiscium sp.]|jgi:RNA polymerase sigma factor (sigma-70 family)|nr:sigma-70 family RNA polymerase sigma factor [Candidatus Epulonipiscium sp.]
MTIKEWKENVMQYERLIFTICYQLVRDYQEAQNLTQETFLSAYTHRESCDITTVKPWLSKIAANKAKDYLKSAYFRHDRGEISYEQQDTSPLPEDIFLDREGAEKIKCYIEALQEPYALVSRLFFLEEKSVAEISLELQRPRKTVQTQLYRAKKILQEKIKGDG